MVSVPSTSPEASRRSYEESSARGSRKVSTYGGSRAWSEDEEAYLLEARQCKTPYKHIASHLQKTELACRLHFHQLAYGTKRKRRSPSASSVATTQGSRNPSVPAQERRHVSQRSIDSTGSRFSATDMNTAERQQAPRMKVSAISPPSSPPPAQRRRLARSESPARDESLGLCVPRASMHPATSAIPSTSTFSPFPLPQSPFTVPPHLMAGQFPSSRPLASPDAFPYTSAPALLHPDANSSAPFRLSSTSTLIQDSSFALLPAPKPIAPTRPPHADILHISGTSSSAPPSVSTVRPPSPNSIDFYRLSGIYGRHRSTFWTSLAKEYGGSVSPSALEAAFLRQTAGSPTSSLPTPPNRSPVMNLSQIMDTDTIAHKVENGKASAAQANVSQQGERRRRSSGTDSSTTVMGGGATCSIASLLTEDKDVWQRRRTA